MPATATAPDARFFIALNAGSGHSETEERRTTIESVLRAAGRRFELTIENPDPTPATAITLCTWP